MSSTGADDLFGQQWGGGPTGFGATSSPSSGSPSGGFDDPPSSPPAFTVVHPPLAWLYAALGAGAVALALVIALRDVIPVVFAGWVLGGPVAFALTAVFQSVDTSRRTQLGYSTGRKAIVTSLYIAALTVGFAAVAVAAVILALWAGRNF